METKNILRLACAALFLMLGVQTAISQPVVHPKAYYDAITYQWTDASGATHTSAITEEATDPYQIVALLKKIYCDPNIPGPKYSAYDQNGNREREVYYGAIGGGWNISANDVTPPYEEGYTLLMVSVKEQLSLRTNDNYGSYEFPNTNSLVNYIGNNVASVQLLTDGLRIGEGMRAGTTFNISGTYNRFFMLGKGQARQKTQWVIDQQNSWFGSDVYGERVPFKDMFEQFSPTDGLPYSQITDFYVKMVGGDAYPVVHDCASVIQNEHYFSMAGKNGHESKSLTGLNIFIPDYRLLYWETYDEDGNHVAGRMMNPYRDLNGRSIRSHSYFEVDYAQYNPEYAPQVGIYTIVLNGKAEEGTEEHTYNVVLDWTSSLNDMAHGTVPQNYTVYVVLTDEDGNETLEEITVTGETTYTYQVPQNEHSYTLTYIVYGVPADGEHDAFVAWSNQASVVIPGWYDFLSLVLNHYESDYVAVEELNYYRNFLNLKNEDALNALTPARVQGGENSFTLYRMDAADLNVMVPVAELQLNVASNGVNYTVTYDNQEPLAGYNVPITTSGNLAIGTGDAIDLSPITFVDQFNAITANNDHPVRYAYVLMLNDNSKSTNTVEVPVFKTSSNIDGFYTLDEVMGDVDHHLTAGVKNANVNITLAPNPAVYYYTVQRGSNMAPNEAISKLQRRTDGTYLEMLDVLPQYFNNVENPGVVARLDNNIITGVPTDYMSYQPVIWTFGEDRAKKDGENSYGSPIWKTGVGSADISVSGVHTDGETGTWKDESNQACWIYYPSFDLTGAVPEGADVIYEPFMFRVWRECNDIRGYYFDDGKPVNDPAADRSSCKLIFEEMTTEGAINGLGGEWDVNPYGFGAKRNAEIKFLVRFYYKKVGDNKLRADGLNDLPLYYVVEKEVTWNEIPTSIHELNAISEVEVTYVNAQGVKSNKPFDGVNIVITRYSDGSTKTTKMVR